MSLIAERGREARSPYLLATHEISTGRSFVGWLVIVTVFLACLAMQSTLLAQVTLLGVTPQLVLVAVVCLTILEGHSLGVTVGFVGGLLLDLLLPESILGLSALVYTVVAYLVAELTRYSPSDPGWMPAVAVAMATVVAEGGYALLAVILGEAWVSLADTMRIVGLIVVYNTLLTPFLFPILARVCQRSRPVGGVGGFSG